MAVEDHQKYDFESYDPRGANNFRGDPNETLPGSLGANPFARGMLVESIWVYITREERANTLRASLSHELDAGKWGRYRGAVLADYRRNRYKNRTYFETSEDASIPTQTTAPTKSRGGRM